VGVAAAAAAPAAAAPVVVAARWAPDFAAEDLVAVERFAAGFRVVFRTVGLRVVDAGAVAVALVAAFDAVALAAAVFDAVLRRRAGLRVAGFLAAGADRPGVTADAA